MASLGIISSTETLMTTPEVDEGLCGKTGEHVVNKTESSSLPRGEVQPAQSSKGHGNESTHGKSEPADSQKDTDVFSFRNYILGISSGVKTPETQSEIKTSLSWDECSEINQEKKTELETQEKAPHVSELETKASCSETQTETVDINENDCLTEEHGDYNGAIKETTTKVSKNVTLLEVIEATKSKKEHVDKSRSDICGAVKDGDSVIATQEGSNLQVKETGALSQMHSEQHAEVNTQSEFDKKPKKGKKKQRRKKKTAVKAEEDVQPLTPLSVGTHAESVTNVQLVPQQVSPDVTQGQQPDSVVNCEQQLSPGEKPIPVHPLSPPSGGTDQLSHLACSPASRRAPLQGPPQSVDHNHTNESCSTNHCTEETTQHERNGNTGIGNGQTKAVTSVQTTVVCSSASADGQTRQRSDAQTREAVVTSGAVPPPQEDQRLPLDSQVCVGEDSVESALEEAVVVVAALPLTTPTMQELIESKGEGESVRHGSLEGVATVAFIESEKAGGEECLGKGNYVSDVGREKDGLHDSHPQLSLIPSQETCSLAFSAPGQHILEESCCSKIPHNVAKAETKGHQNIRITDTEESSTGGQAREKEALFLEAFISTSPYGLLTGPDCLDHSVVSLEAAEEGGEEDMKHKGGLASEHIIFSQPEGSVGGVSSAEKETCPPTDVAESLLKPQDSSEQILTITKSHCTEKDHSSQCWQEQQNAADLPRSAPSEQSSGNANGEVRAEGKLNVISEEAQPSTDGTCEESSITQEERDRGQVFPQPQTSSQQTSIKQESNNVQQVAPERDAFEAGTAEASSEFQVQANKGKQTMSSLGLHVCDDNGRTNKMHFEDLKKASGLATEFDSLLPLTVCESLQHPVVETSYIFQDFLNNNKPEISTSAADRKDELPIWRPPPLTQEDVHLNKGEPGIKDDHINLIDDNSNLKADTLELKSTDETHSKLLQSANDANQNVVKNLALMQNDHLKVEHVPGKVVDLLGAGEKELDKLSVESELPPSLPAEGVVPVDIEKRENIHILTSGPGLPTAADACKHLNVFAEIPDVKLTELVTSTAAETVAVTCADSPQPPTQLDKPPLCGLDPSDPLKATLEDDVYLQEDKPASEATTHTQLISTTEQSASGHVFVLKPPGPMLNHLEVIADSNSSHEKTDAFKADSGIMEVPGKESTEMAMMSVPQNNLENRNDAVESDILVNKCVIGDLKIEGVSAGLAKTEADGVISQSPSEPYFTGKVICEAPTKDDLINISCSLSSDLPDDVSEQDGSKEKNAIEIQPNDEKRQVKGSTDNRKETDNNVLELGKARQTNGQGNEAFEEVSGHNAESLLGDMKEEGKKNDDASESETKTTCFSCESHPEKPEDTAEVQSSSELAYDKSLCQNLKESLQSSSERDMAQSDAVLVQSKSNCLDPQQALFPGINLGAEKGDGFVGTLCLSGSQNEVMIDVAKREDGTEAVQGIGQVCLSPPASISNDKRLDAERSSIANAGTELDSFHVNDGKLKLDENKLSRLLEGGTVNLTPDAELLSEPGGKDQEAENLPAVCRGGPETSTNTDISAVPASQEQETCCFPVSCISEVSTGSGDIYIEDLQSGNEADGVYRQPFSSPPEPVERTVEKDSTAVKSNSSETEECEIQHTVDESLKLQSSNITSATQNDVGAPVSVKCSTEENTTSAQQSAIKEPRATKEEGMETNLAVNLQMESAEDAGTGSFEVSDVSVCGESHHSSETIVGNAEESVCAFRATEYQSNGADKGAPDVIAVSSVISSKCTADLSSPAEVPTQLEKSHDQTLLSKPEDQIVVDPVVAATEDISLHKGSSFNSPVEQKTANTEMEDVSENIKAELKAQEQSTVWIKVLKEAAADCQSKQQNTVVISR